MKLRTMPENLGHFLEDIEKLRLQYGDKILKYTVYCERPDERDAAYKKYKQKWGIIEYLDGYDTTYYFECRGGVGIDNEKKAIFINVNF